MGFWIILSTIAVIHTYWKMKVHAMAVQRLIVVFPICKIFDSFVNGLYINECPWVNMVDDKEKYVDMARISIITITYTVFLTTLYLMS
jgi:hypothetical protein